MNIRRVAAVVLGLLVTLALALALALALNYRFRPHPHSPLPVVIVRFNTPHCGLLHVAEAKGYFAEEGLTARIVTTLTGIDAIDQVLRGDADVATATETPIALALAAGKQVKVIATIFSSQWHVGLVARKDHGIVKAADLKGKRVGFVFGTAAHYQLEAFLAFHGIPLDSISMLPGTPDELSTDLVSGKLDAISTWTPYMARVQQKLGSNGQTFLPNEFYKQMTNLVVRKDYVMRNRGATERLLRALLKAESFVKSHPDAAIDIIAAASGVPDTELRGHGDPLTYELTLKQPLLLAMENEVRWAFRRGLVPIGPFPDVLRAFEPEPLRALKPDGVTISE